MVEAELLDGSTAELAIDDFSVIEWHSAFTNSSKPPFFSIDSRQPAYLGLSNTTKMAKAGSQGVVVTTQ